MFTQLLYTGVVLLKTWNEKSQTKTPILHIEEATYISAG